ncbi:receptor-like protein kinase HERK 1 [Lactuca sativa]|uniref:receptor-like protein kinase HERK 1 n=1 Tax=Lactuca sativa TaxID=4236 RepID=UPI0022AEEBD0|nr:receptor-like protein kinase HERK 1 [Lactuca sativa]
MSSSSSYEDFAHLKIPFKEIVSATNNFSDANLIEESALMGKAYKGKLMRSNQQIDIVAQRFDHEHRDRVTEFLKEILKLKHKNLVSMFGFCDEVGMIIIYHEAKGSLDTFLRNPELTWMKRLQICVGVAYALSYIYCDNPRDFSVIRCDIGSSKILLDDNWEPKLSGFELSQKQTAAQRNESLMSSFGKVLIEVLCGNMDVGNASFGALFISKYEETRLDGMIDQGLWKQMDPQSFRIFSEIAYYCLKEKPSQCPNIGVVVMELEKTVESQWRHERALISHVSVEGTTSKNLEVINFFSFYR